MFVCVGRWSWEQTYSAKTMLKWTCGQRGKNEGPGVEVTVQGQPGCVAVCVGKWASLEATAFEGLGRELGAQKWKVGLLGRGLQGKGV